MKKNREETRDTEKKKIQKVVHRKKIYKRELEKYEK